MKSILSIVVILISTVNYLSQSKKNDIKFFDIDTFKKYKTIESSMRDARDTLKQVILESYEFKKQDSLIYMEKLSTIDTYRVVRSKIGGSYKKVCVYHLNYSLFIESYYFSDKPVGNHKTYSETGKLVKETNYDQIRKDWGCLISIFDVARSIKNDFKINIEKEDQILRWEFVKDDQLQRLVYKIACPPKHPDGRPPRGFVYDAITGKFLEYYAVDILR